MDSLDVKQKINKEYQDYANSLSPKSKNCKTVMTFIVEA